MQELPRSLGMYHHSYLRHRAHHPPSARSILGPSAIRRIGIVKPSVPGARLVSSTPATLFEATPWA